MEYRLSIEGLDEVKKDLKHFNERVRAGLLSEVADTTTKIHKQAKEDAPMGAEGDLKRGVGQIVTDLTGEVWSGAAHSIAVEQGQKPGKWANVEDLMLWVKRKLRVPKNRLSSVTYLVNRKIFMKGTDAQPFFEPAVKKHGKDFHRRVMKLLKRL